MIDGLVCALKAGRDVKFLKEKLNLLLNCTEMNSSVISFKYSSLILECLTSMNTIVILMNSPKFGS